MHSLLYVLLSASWSCHSAHDTFGISVWLTLSHCASHSLTLCLLVVCRVAADRRTCSRRCVEPSPTNRKSRLSIFVTSAAHDSVASYRWWRTSRAAILRPISTSAITATWPLGGTCSCIVTENSATNCTAMNRRTLMVLRQFSLHTDILVCMLPLIIFVVFETFFYKFLVWQFWIGQMEIWVFIILHLKQIINVQHHLKVAYGL